MKKIGRLIILLAIIFLVPSVVTWLYGSFLKVDLNITEFDVNKETTLEELNTSPVAVERIHDMIEEKLDELERIGKFSRLTPSSTRYDIKIKNGVQFKITVTGPEPNRKVQTVLTCEFDKENNKDDVNVTFGDIEQLYGSIKLEDYKQKINNARCSAVFKPESVEIRLPPGEKLYVTLLGNVYLNASPDKLTYFIIFIITLFAWSAFLALIKKTVESVNACKKFVVGRD